MKLTRTIWALSVGSAAALVLASAVITSSARAENPPRVLINGQELAGAQMAPTGRIIVPMRPLFEGIGAQIFWDQTTHTVRAFYPGHTVTLQAGNREAMADNQTVVLDTEPVIVNDRLLVPLRFVAETLDATLAWDDQKREARVTLGVTLPENALAEAEPQPVVPYTEDELELMIKVVNSEAYDEPYEGKVAVAAVIVNRVLSPRFAGKTIRDVLMAGAPNRCQFNVVCNGLMNRLPIQADTRQATLEGLAGNDPTQSALYFANLPRAKYQSFWATLTRTVVIGTHTFFK